MDKKDGNKGKRGNSSPVKGGIVTIDKDDSDKDSLDLDNDDGLTKALAEA